MTIPPSYSQSNILEKTKDDTKITIDDLRRRRTIARENTRRNLIMEIKKIIIAEADQVYPPLNKWADLGYDEVSVTTYIYSEFGYDKKKTGRKIIEYVANAVDIAITEINKTCRYSVKLARSDTRRGKDKYKIESDIDFYWNY